MRVPPEPQRAVLREPATTPACPRRNVRSAPASSNREVENPLSSVRQRDCRANPLPPLEPAPNLRERAVAATIRECSSPAVVAAAARAVPVIAVAWVIAAAQRPALGLRAWRERRLARIADWDRWVELAQKRGLRTQRKRQVARRGEKKDAQRDRGSLPEKAWALLSYSHTRARHGCMPPEELCSTVRVRSRGVNAVTVSQEFAPRPTKSLGCWLVGNGLRSHEIIFEAQHVGI